MVDPAKHPSASTGEDGEAAIPAKTVTQIIFEQLEDMIYIRYGDKSKAFYKPSSKDECAAALADMGSIAQDAIARIEADFEGLYMDLVAFNIQAWRTHQNEKLARLMLAARHLCTAFQIPFSRDQWVRVIKHVRTIRNERLPDHKDNRVLWAAALAASQGTDMEADMEVFRVLISFFVAWTDGTGSVERFLGAHAAFLQAHVGGEANDAGEICLEIAKEGPSTEGEIFENVEGVLRFTEFSRSCARLWRTHHGRRFASYRERKDKGVKKEWRMKGSIKAVGVGQARAVKALVALAREHAVAGGQPGDVDTFIGVGRRTLMRKVAKIGCSKPTKKLGEFRETTAKRSASKARAGVWQGFNKTPIQYRPKPGGALPSMVALPHREHRVNGEDETSASSKKRRGQFLMAGTSVSKRVLRMGTGKWLGRQGAAAVSQRKQKADDRQSSAIQSKAPARVSSTSELHIPNLDTKKLLLWLKIVAHGQSVRTTATGCSEECYLPAQETCAKLVLHKDFEQKHYNMSAALRREVLSTDSKWQLAKSEDETGSTTIRTLEDCRQFLLRMRRLPAMAGVQATFLKPQGASLAASRGVLKPPGASLAASHGGPRISSGRWPRRVAA